MAYKCKICGGQTTVDTISGIATCEYCGTRQALPLFTEDSERLLYESGNNYLAHSEYDKAEHIFNQLLTIKPSAAELYWDLVLCKYGVTYVKDPESKKYIPTCNRTHYTPIFTDKNYLKAIELSSGEKKTLFKEDAKTIDNIQKGIIAVSKKEKPFDIFISYKETDSNGNRTKDSVEAQKLYEKLTEAGYKVFFSRITLEDKIGTEYEPYIYAALYSSKVMLTICSSKENIEAVWVKNEWSRYLSFRQNDNGKTLLPLYFDMEKEALPDEFALLSSYDMTADGFQEELLRGIKKLIPLPIMLAKKRKKMAKIAAVAAAVAIVIAGAVTAVVLSNQAKEEQKVAQKNKEEKAYQAAMALFENKDYTAAEKAFAKLGDYKDATHMAERCPIQPEYDAAMQLYYDGKYAQATWAFEALGDYEDATEQKEKSMLSWRKSVAAVAVDNQIGEYRYGSYYINKNGTVDSFPSDLGTAHKNTGINVVSVTTGMQLFALHTDGTLDNISQNGNIEKDLWQDLIQTSLFYNVTNVALRADGKVLFGEISNEDWHDGWLAYVYDWEKIVMLTDADRINGNGGGSALAGVDADGTVYLCTSHPMRTFMEYEEEFQDVKLLEITTDIESMFVNAVALRNDGKLVSYINGELSVEDAETVADVWIDDMTIYLLHKDGKLYKKGSKSVLLADVVTIFDDYAVTRSGAIYTLGRTMVNTGTKSVVYDEWLKRME